MDLDHLLRDTADVPGPDAHALRRGDAALATAIATAPRVRVRRRFAPRVLVPALAAAATVAALLVVPSLGIGGGAPAPGGRASEVVLAIGSAPGEPAVGYPDAAYWYAKSTYERSGGTHTREIWIGHRAEGVLLDDGQEMDGLRGDDPVVAIPLGVASFPAGARGLSWDELYALPTDAGALEAELRAGIDGAGNGDDSEMFVIVGDLLRESPAPPALRRALWEVAAGIPGVTVAGAVTDRAGRPGIAVDRDGDRYIFDPGTGRLLWEGRAAQAEGGWRATYVEQGPRDAAPAPDSGYIAAQDAEAKAKLATTEADEKGRKVPGEPIR